MTHNVSRRTLAKGAAWAAPAVAATTAIPVYAASPVTCSTSSQAAIDNVFNNLPLTIPIEMNTYTPNSAGNGFTNTTFINFKNLSTSPITFGPLNPLKVRIEVVQMKQTAVFDDTNGYGSWGTVSDLGYDSTTGIQTYEWTFMGTIPGQGNGDNEADMAIWFADTWARGMHETQYLRITPLQIVAPAPTIAEILPDAGQQTACLTYYTTKYNEYNAKANTTLAFAGPKQTTPITMNQTVDTRDYGNFSSSFLSYDRDGIW